MNQPQIPLYKTGETFNVGSHQTRVIKYLASGGFAQVYKVEFSPADPYINSNIGCLKRVIVPDKQSLNVLRAEVEAMKLLRGNRHVVSYIDSNAAKSTTVEGNYEVFLLMEYCEKGGLIDFLNTRLKNRLRDDEILTIMSQTTQGVLAMHALQPPLIHRDIKIENVLISANGDYKICDFGSVCGIVRPPRTNQELEYVKHDVMRNTTAQYRSPEMLNLASGFPIDEKSDIWALGVFLYKICYYITPFEKEGESAILHARFQFPALPRYNDRTKNLIKVLLSLLPTSRPNICQVLEEVSRIQGVKCPVPNFYLTRAMNASQNSNLISINSNPTITTNIAPAGLVHANSMVDISGSPRKIAMHEQARQTVSPLLIPIDNQSPTKLPVSASLDTNGNIPVLQYTKSFDISQSNNAKKTKPDMSILLENSSSLAKSTFSTELASSPQKSFHNHTFNQHSQNNAIYVDDETQTLNSHSPIRRTSSRASSFRSNFSLDSEYDIPDTQTNDNTLARKLSHKIKNVLTGESGNISPVRSRQNTGDSLWNSAVGKIRSGLTGGNNKRSASYGNTANNTNSLNRRVSSLLRDTENLPSKSELEKENVLLQTRDKVGIQPKQLNDQDNHLKQTPVRLVSNKAMKASIQQKVQNLLNNRDNIPTRRTASGYGKYTTEPLENIQESSQMNDEKLDRRNATRKSSVLVTPLSSLKSKIVPDRTSRETRSKRAPPPVPKKPNNLTVPKPKTKSDNRSSRILSDSTEILMDVDVDDLETSFRQRFPSTVH
ncbi:serine/threonine protein kinase [Maudiozyma humilis]|uniref:non-specific serine/threonine protein kinase n=1 Tax=Maudiozyma humilis TaxID=51915 RepID=A0AAV5RRF3_MAUHU|nr:serine/threonine protein kinase [Kazachstania humilis]